MFILELETAAYGPKNTLKVGQTGPSKRFLPGSNGRSDMSTPQITDINSVHNYLFQVPLVWVKLFREVKWIPCSPVSASAFDLQFTHCGASWTGSFLSVHSYSQCTPVELLHRDHLEKQHQAVGLRAEAALGCGLYGTGVQRRQAAQHRHVLQSVGRPSEAQDSDCQGLLLLREGHSEMEAWFW